MSAINLEAARLSTAFNRLPTLDHFSAIDELMSLGALPASSQLAANVGSF